ncbi:MAG: hypothetical protein LBR21_08450 [Propionibacteriaceae bacterium]|nr:hypothetical protein [Propionibacteriaceae bacterium]
MRAREVIGLILTLGMIGCTAEPYTGEILESDYYKAVEKNQMSDNKTIQTWGRQAHIFP